MGTDKVSLYDALLSKQHRYASWNALALGFTCEFTGINTLVLFSTNIFIKMKATGGLAVPVIVAVQIVNTLKTTALFFSWAPTKLLGMRGGMISV